MLLLAILTQNPEKRKALKRHLEQSMQECSNY